MPSAENFTEEAKTAANMLDGDPRELYIVKKKLGEGASGSVFVVTQKNNSEEKALKQIVPKNAKEMSNITNEIALMQLSPHPNITNYYESYKH
jgi:serine/threonine protein kinase